MSGPLIGWKVKTPNQIQSSIFFFKKPVRISLQVKWQDVGRDASWEKIYAQRLARGNI